MTLEIKIEDYHFYVRDSCNVNINESAVTALRVADLERHPSNVRDNEELARSTSLREHSPYLFYANVALAHVYYKGNMELTLTCPECRTDYVLGRAEFEVAERVYQEAIKE